MKDIDFDELDKAVSSVLGTKTATKTTTKPKVSPKVAHDEKPAASDKVAVSTPASSVAVSPQIIRQVSPAVRRSGRFMDVVHPSSDMKSAAPAVTVTKRPKLAPLSADLKAPEPRAVEPEESKAETTSFPTLDTLSAESSPRIESETTEERSAPPEDATPKEPAVHQRSDHEEKAHEKKDAEPEAAHHDIPSNLSFSEPDTGHHHVDTPVAPEEKPVEPVVVEPESKPEPEFVMDEDATPVESEPQTPAADSAPVTPFITGTKVDKRPLGAFATGAVAQSTDTSNGLDLNAMSAAVPDFEPKTGASLTTSLPAASTDPSTLGNTADTTTAHPVFDTSAYHQPMVASKAGHKSHAWIWILLTIGLLAIGAGLGALWFMAGY